VGSGGQGHCHGLVDAPNAHTARTYYRDPGRSTGLNPYSVVGVGGETGDVSVGGWADCQGLGEAGDGFVGSVA